MHIHKCYKLNLIKTIIALRHHTLSQLRQLQDVEGFGKILMGLRNVSGQTQDCKTRNFDGMMNDFNFNCTIFNFMSFVFLIEYRQESFSVYCMFPCCERCRFDSEE